MSQTHDAITLIDRESGLGGWILRPLSARLLPETEPERRGWVDRSRLLAIRGRGRQEQLALARGLRLVHFHPPGGGCLLTDAIFSRKLRDLFEHLPEERTAPEDVELLRLGRHFRLSPELKVVLGRNAEENRRLRGFETGGRWLVEPVGFSGPSALVCGPRDEESLSRAVELIARYTRAPGPALEVEWREGGGMRRRALGAAALATAPGAATP